MRSTLQPLTDPILAIDALIRAGELAKAKIEFDRVLRDKPTREQLTPLAALARRLNLAERGARLLHPVVRPSGRSAMKPNPKERAEYAACLVRLGAHSEALGILRELSFKSNPEVLLFRAAALVTQWNYAGAVRLYRQFLRLPGIHPYQRRIARVNLAAALVHEGDYLRATSLLRDLLSEVAAMGQKFLYASLLELGAQSRILAGKYDDAIRFLASAGLQLKDTESREEFYVRKWDAIARLGKSGGRSAQRSEITRLRKEATAKALSEAVRDLDLWEGILCQDQRLIDKVYFGSPFPEYRAWILARTKSKYRPPSHFDWVLGPKKSGEQIDLEPFLADPAISIFTRRLVAALTRDFYRSLGVAELHGHLFPGDFFNPFSSGERVRQSVHRARKALEESVPQLTVDSGDAGYFLVSPNGVSVRLSPDRAPPQDENPVMQKLKLHFAHRYFSIADAEAATGLPRRTLQRNAAELERSGSGSKTRYRFPPP